VGHFCPPESGSGFRIRIQIRNNGKIVQIFLLKNNSAYFKNIKTLDYRIKKTFNSIFITLKTEKLCANKKL
jgi:hypothetical protein